MGLAPWLGSLLVACTAAACGEARTGGSLSLLEFRQKDFGSVALNEELLFFFSDELDPASVTSDSVRFLDERGRDVAGERVVRGNALSFLPELPCASDLSDGGLRPGASYRVVLGGFPRLDGIRSERGALLSACLRLDFYTADVPGTSPLFLDPFVGPFLFWPRGKRSYPVELQDGELVLEYGEALDPSSVPQARFELSRYLPGTTDLAPIRTVARLIENRRNRAVLLLEPVGTGGIVESLPPDRYYLRMPGRELRTLGGRAVEPGWGFGVLELVVPRTTVEIDFSQSGERYNELPIGCDGTAIWSPDSGLGLRYPAAAGSGEAGLVELRQCPPGSDLQAARLTIPPEAVVDLSGLRGPVVLRSQTAITVLGRIERRGHGSTADDPITLELESATQLPPALWGPLSAWVERFLDPDQPWARQPWTMVIAGGDILVPAGGAIEVEGPLVLVAGGWIRVEGVAVSHEDLWKTPEGGGMYSHASNRQLPFRLDPPGVNPLRTTLTVGAMSLEFPWSPGKGSWRTILVGGEGEGRIRAQFLQADGDVGSRLLENPCELKSGPMRGLIRLAMDPGRGEPWKPPHLESLHVEAVSGPLESR